ncbi:MAG: glycosyltransferase family 2 protein [Yoonia sp.]|uniref:glycosyltransferase family 2 protein n=1 Tax=Yoonia sp. TaxID=2212373 RepID=UPI003EF6C89E
MRTRKIGSDFHLRFCDDTGRVILAVFRRKSVRGPQHDRLVFNGQSDDGDWGSEITVTLRPGMEETGLVFHLLPWQLEVRSENDVLLSINPQQVFGTDFDASKISKLESLIPPNEIDILSADCAQLMSHLSAGHTDLSVANDIALIVICEGREAETRAQTAAYTYLYSSVEIISAGENRDPKVLQERLNEIIENVTQPNLAIVSGEEVWQFKGLERSIARYFEQRHGDTFLPLDMTCDFELGKNWGIILPRMSPYGATVQVRANRVLIEPAFLSTAHWLVPVLWDDPEKIFELREDNTRLPAIIGSNDQIVDAFNREVPQVQGLSFGASPSKDAPSTAFSGYREINITDTTDLTLRNLLVRLRSEVRRSCSTHYIAFDAGGMTPETRNTLISQSLTNGLTVARAGDTPPLGVILSRAQIQLLTEPGFLLSLPKNLRQQIDSRKATIAEVIECLEACCAANLVIVHYINPSHAPLPLSLQDGGDVFWFQSIDTLREILTSARDPENVSELAANPAWFANIAMSALLSGLHVEITEAAIAADHSEASDETALATVMTCAQKAGRNLSLQYRQEIGRTLLFHSYEDEYQTIIMPFPEVSEDTLPQALKARQAELDLLRCIWNKSDNSFVHTGIADLVPNWEQGPLTIKDTANQLAHYLAVRGAWDRVTQLYDDLASTPEVQGIVAKFFLLGQFLNGSTAGVARALESHRDTIPEWDAYRLRLWYMSLTGTPAQYEVATEALIANEDDLVALAADQPASEFEHVSGPLKPLNSNQIGCIIVARNELTRLDWLVSYYRLLGVDRFFLIDNMSTDDTLEHFADNTDVTVLQTEENYRDSRYGVKWHNEIAETYMMNCWVLTVDADEMMVFDGSATPGSLHELRRRLDAAGAETILTPMIDMYADGRLQDIKYTQGDPLIEQFCWFDGTGYRFDPVSSCPPTTMSGGPRTRMFWNNRHAPNMPHMAMQKAAFVKWTPGMRYLSSTHEMTHRPVAVETGALLHFKFLPDFHARAMEEVRRNQHYDGAREYKVYADKLSQPDNQGFMYEGSQRYEGPETLIELGLITPAQTTKT